MLNRQRARYSAVLAIIVGLGVVACPRVTRAAVFAELSDNTNNVGATFALPLDALNPPAHPQTKQPFGLQAAAPVTGSLEAMWRSAARRLPGEYGILARCRSDSAKCSPAATRFLAVIDRAADQNGWTRIAEINRAINLDIRPVSDTAQYGAVPLWPTPLMTFASNAGDCKDYAIAKYVALRELGLSADDLRLVIVYIRSADEYHAVTAVRYDGRWLILDNRTSDIKNDVDIADYDARFVIDGEGVRRVTLAQPQNGERNVTPNTAGKPRLFAGPENLPAVL
jgi:predicted transglutaminase-like cysteine proteinase